MWYGGMTVTVFVLGRVPIKVWGKPKGCKKITAHKQKIVITKTSSLDLQ